MKTDEAFYELFKLDPRSLFRLVQLELEGNYRFESITIKTTEKRLDGLCYRTDDDGPNVFVEIQGYDDPTIYWRALRELATYDEQTHDSKPCVLVVLFVDEKYDPGTCVCADFIPPNRFIRTNVKDGLQAVWEQAGALTVLKPLLVERKDQIFQNINQWKSDLVALPVSQQQHHVLMELLEYLILQRFPGMTRKEIITMLQLTPLEKTAAGQEVFHMGEQQGLTKGELIGEIRFAQKMLKRPISPAARLSRKSLKALKAMLKELEAELTSVTS